MELFQNIMIWKNLDEVSAVRYSCLKDLQNGKFAVQSADFFRLPLDERAVLNFSIQFAALFIEISPRERCSWFGTIEEAIINHEREFC